MSLLNSQGYITSAEEFYAFFECNKKEEMAKDNSIYEVIAKDKVENE